MKYDIVSVGSYIHLVESLMINTICRDYNLKTILNYNYLHTNLEDDEARLLLAGFKNKDFLVCRNCITDLYG